MPADLTVRAATDAAVTRSGAQTLDGIALVAATREVAAFTITSAADADGGNVLVTLGNLDGTTTTYTVPVAASDSAVVVAGKIANLAGGYAGWTAARRASPNDHIVDFTATLGGVRPDASYSPGTGGATGTVSTTTQGAAGDTVLLFDQVDGSKNGPWNVQNGDWNRHLAYDTSAEFVPGFTVFVREGTQYGGTVFRFRNGQAPTLEVSMLNFTQAERYVVERAAVGGGLAVDSDGVFSLPASGVTPGPVPPGAVPRVRSTGIMEGYTAGVYTNSVISGLVLQTILGSDEVQLLPGASWVSATNEVLEYSSLVTLYGSEVSIDFADAWHYVYLYRAASGNVRAELSKTVAPSPTATALLRYQKGTDATRAYVGSLRTNGAQGTYRHQVVSGPPSSPVVFYLEETTVSPFRRLTDGTATTATNVDCSPVVPLTSRLAHVRINNTSDQSCRISNPEVPGFFRRVGPTSEREMWVPVDSSQRFQYALSAAPAAGGVTIDVTGYQDRR